MKFRAHKNRFTFAILSDRPCTSRLHLDCQFWHFEVQKLAYMLILAAVVIVPYLSTVGGSDA